jgi:hypothetical protein
VPLYKIQREYARKGQISVEAESEEKALKIAEDEARWEYALDVKSRNYMFVMGEEYE